MKKCEFKKLKANEAQKRVVECAEHINAWLTDSVSDLNDDQRWLVRGRIVNFLFANHFHLTIRTSEELLRQREDSLRIENH